MRDSTTPRTWMRRRMTAGAGSSEEAGWPALSSSCFPRPAAPCIRPTHTRPWNHSSSLRRVTDPPIFFAGTAGSVPAARRGLPAVLVRRGGDRVLFDCGEGTQRQLLRSVGLADLTDVFITHLHADNWLGLPGMLKTFDLRDRSLPLTVHGPAPLREVMQIMRVVYGRLRYPLSVVELQAGDVVERDGYRVHAVEAAHRGPALAYAMVE